MVITGIDTVSDTRHFWQTTCNRWTCIYCGPWKTWTLCKRIEAAKPNRFITLTTARPEGQTPRDVWNVARRKVPEVARWIRDKTGECEYCRVLEEHKSGYPHFHLLVRSGYVKQEELSRYWCSLTEAFIVDIRKVNTDDNVAGYVAKYLTKKMDVGFTDRRVTNSKRFFEPKPAKQDSDRIMGEMERHKGSMESVWAWCYPNVQIEEVGPSHWIGVTDRQPTRGQRFRIDGEHVPDEFIHLTKSHVLRKMNEVRTKSLTYFE